MHFLLGIRLFLVVIVLVPCAFCGFKIRVESDLVDSVQFYYDVEVACKQTGTVLSEVIGHEGEVEDEELSEWRTTERGERFRVHLCPKGHYLLEVKLHAEQDHKLVRTRTFERKILDGETCVIDFDSPA